MLKRWSTTKICDLWILSHCQELWLGNQQLLQKLKGERKEKDMEGRWMESDDFMPFYFYPHHQSKAVQQMRQVFSLEFGSSRGSLIHGQTESRSVVSDSATPWICRPWNSPGQNTEVRSLSLLQGTFPTQGSNPHLPHCTQILQQLSHPGNPHVEKLGFFKRISLLKHSWCAVLCKFLGYSTVLVKGYLCSFSYSFLHCDLSWDIESSSLGYMVNPYCLSILYTVMCISPIL